MHELVRGNLLNYFNYHCSICSSDTILRISCNINTSKLKRHLKSKMQISETTSEEPKYSCNNESKEHYLTAKMIK